MEFVADKISIRGPRVDGSWVVSFEIGEYEVNKLQELFTLDRETLKRVVVQDVIQSPHE